LADSGSPESTSAAAPPRCSAESQSANPDGAWRPSAPCFENSSALGRFVVTVAADCLIDLAHDKWIEGGRYLGVDVLNRSRAVLTSPDKPANKEHATTPALTT
jgi:hypothetical protein